LLTLTDGHQFIRLGSLNREDAEQTKHARFEWFLRALGELGINPEGVLRMRFAWSENAALNRDRLTDRLLTKDEVVQIPFEDLIILLSIENAKALANPNLEESLQKRRLLQSELFRKIVST
jgi:hypothetical protein